MSLLKQVLFIAWGLALGVYSAQAAVITAWDSLAVRQTTPTPTVEFGLNPKNATTNATTDRYIMIRFGSATDFGLSAKDATFSITADTVDFVGSHSFTVYGVNDGTANDEAINASSYRPTAGSVWASGAALISTTNLTNLGTLSNVTAGTTPTLDSAALLSFIQADTNGIITLLLFQPPKNGDNVVFLNEESLTPPTLTVNAGVNPDPSPLVGRPFIWVKNSDKAGILDKIAIESWAAGAYDDLVARAASHLTAHQTDRRGYLSEIPVEDWSVATPKMKTIQVNTENPVLSPLHDKLNQALDAAILYYLTGDATYASLAADVMHNTVKTMLPIAPSTEVGNGGWLIQRDFLYEARFTGTQLPIIYDFLRDYLLANPVYDYKSNTMVAFDIDDAQQVFRTLYDLALNHGSKNNNWSALMSTTMLNSLLALDDDAVRAAYLNVYLVTGSSRQASLDYDYRYYDNPGDIWPESLQYATEVGEIRSCHMVMLERIYPTLDLFGAYPNLPISIPRVPEMRYPNQEVILFGDGPRTRGEPYFMYEMVYQHARARGLTGLYTNFGARIKDGMESGAYDRSQMPAYGSLSMHNQPLHLLWGANDVPESAQATILPRTDALPYAGVTLQRNTTDDPNYGLMCFVGGAGYTHSHASGMGMELYGLGEVMGPKSGASTYQSTFHENYCRVFASNNTVIVNGASRGQGGWQDISINRVQNVAMEPQPKQAAVSPNYSFTCSSFLDDKGTLAEATQQRTMGIVRTSPTTGFYVDFFRSDSSLSGEYHDYIYRNIGETTVDIRSGGSPITMTSQPNRFQSDIGDEYQQPGWRYFTNTVVSPSISDGVTLQFVASMPDATRYMDMHIPAVAAREIAKVDSPPMSKSPSPYNRQNVPAVVIRQNGEAWNNAFAVVYEPHFGADGGTIQSVEALKSGGVVRGVKVVSAFAGETVTHFVFSNPNANETYTDAGLGLSFNGRYGVVEHRDSGAINLYLGQGSSVAYQGRSLTTNSGSNSAAEARLVPYFDPVVTSNTPVTLLTPALTGYAAWAETQAPNNLPDDDFDGDGVRNCIEYILGGDRFGPDTAKLPEFLKDGDTLAFRFLRDQNSIDGSTVVTIELGDDPGNLTEVHPVPDAAVSNPEGMNVIKDSSPGFDTILFTIPVGENTRKFGRLRVTL